MAFLSYNLLFVAAWLLALVVWESAAPAREAGSRWRRFGFHLSLTVLNSALYEWFIGSRVAKSLGPATSAAHVATTLLALDFFLYWLHRANHSRWLWRFHQVHHSDTQLDVSTAFREHPGQTLVSSALMMLPLYWLRPSPLEYAIYSAMLAGFLYFQHANVALAPALEKFLGRAIVTPRGHVPHHHLSAGPSCNFGVMLNVWDKLFGTWRAPADEAPFGVVTEDGDPLGWSTVLLRPFVAVALLLVCGCKWTPDSAAAPDLISPETQTEIDYGRELVAHTAKYLGPAGTVMKNVVGRTNCQNCHLDAGTKPFGVSFATVHNRYPDYRAREGRVVTLEERINHCFERPMNGQPLLASSREMVAILTYLRHLARGTPAGYRQRGDKLNEAVLIPQRAADPARGARLYGTHCVRCHMTDGQGQLNAEKNEYVYPPLWGPESYNEASSMARLIKLAAFVKANMPLGATVDKPVLTDEEAFDVAAFVNDAEIHPRPKTKWTDYPDSKQRPIDERKGPYVDPFPESQHRLGPYGPIIRYLIEKRLPAFY